MSRVHYAGTFDPERIPISSPMRARALTSSAYISAPGFKAVAYHPLGGLFIVTGAPSQHAAEEQALAICNGSVASGQGRPLLSVRFE